jgi:hypothetical protein
MATDFVRSAFTYSGEKEFAFGHCIMSGYERGRSGLAKKIAGG